MLLTPGSVSWHNHAHDVISAVIYADLVVAQLLLARRFGRDAADREQARMGWRRWRPWLLVSAGVTAGLLTAFAAGTSAADTGILQRAAVTVPLAAITAIAIRLTRDLARPGGTSAAGSGNTYLAAMRG